MYRTPRHGPDALPLVGRRGGSCHSRYALLLGANLPGFCGSTRLFLQNSRFMININKRKLFIINCLVDPTGLEPGGCKSEGFNGSDGCEFGESVNAHVDAHDFPKLAEIAAIWPSLGEQVQAAVLTLVRASRPAGMKEGAACGAAVPRASTDRRAAGAPLTLYIGSTNSAKGRRK